MLIDLSHTIASGMMQVASLPAVEVCRVSALAEGKPTNGQALRISGHSGTHIDAPLHVFDELASIETFPADRFIGPGVALSVPKGPRDPVSAADLDAADWLLEHGVRLVALDMLSPDVPPARRAPDAQLVVHQRLLGNDVLIAENLTGLGQLVGKRLQVYALPIKVAEGDGAPARICVEVVDS